MTTLLECLLSELPSDQNYFIWANKVYGQFTFNSPAEILPAHDKKTQTFECQIGTCYNIGEIKRTRTLKGLTPIRFAEIFISSLNSANSVDSRSFRELKKAEKSGLN